MVLEQLDIHMQKKKKKKNPDLELTAFIKICSTWIRGLNVKGNTIKLLKNNTGEDLDGLEFDLGDLDSTWHQWHEAPVVEVLSHLPVHPLVSWQRRDFPSTGLMSDTCSLTPAGSMWHQTTFLRPKWHKAPKGRDRGFPM